MAREEDIEETGIYKVERGDRVRPAHVIKHIPRIQRVRRPKGGLKKIRTKRQRARKFKVKGGYR